MGNSDYGTKYAYTADLCKTHAADSYMTTIVLHIGIQWIRICLSYLTLKENQTRVEQALADNFNRRVRGGPHLQVPSLPRF